MKRFLIVLATIVGVTFSGVLPVQAMTIASDACLFAPGDELCEAFAERSALVEQKPKVVYPDNLGEEVWGGYYVFPESPSGEYGFTWFSWEELRCGSKELIGVVYTAIINFNELYPDVTIEIGEVNAPGHITHDRGVDIDVSGWQTDEQAISFGKALVDTGQVDYILYRDRAVIDKVNTHANSIGEDGPMRYDWEHSHFHVSIDDEFAGPRSTKCDRSW